MSDLNTQFEAAAADVKNLKTRPTDQEMLDTYGLYKQATVGDNTTAQPWAVQLEARAKWEAWTKYKGTSSDDAKKQYIELVNKLKATYGQ